MDKISGISKAQKNIILTIGIVVVVVVLFIMYLYIPMNKKLAGLKAEITAAEAEVNQIRQSFGDAKSLEEALAFLNKKIEVLSKKFPIKEEIVLRELPGIVSKLGIEVLSIRPGKKIAIGDIGGVPVPVKGSTVYEFSISMDLITTYKKLGELFTVLHESFPIFIRVDSVRLSSSGKDEKGFLNVDLNLFTYVIS